MQITIREPGSAFTHLLAMVMAMFAAIPLLIKASIQSGGLCFIAMTVFMASMILLYGASATYHSVMVSAPVLRIFRKIDHMMIFILIAGSYTPVCLMILDPRKGSVLLAVVWSIAAIGILVKVLWITCPKWFSSLLYISMGWVCLGVFGTLWNVLTLGGFLWLLLGGILYTIGGVLYALKIQVFHGKYPYFGIHELFHVFVMAGSACHFIFMYLYVA